ncbi:MAG: NADH-quinone oxidoreductase subunit J [Chitinophagales bacterium]|nr:NADH-quinone oxidoreductase subunit J [Chitinophagales bacterium]
MLTSSFYFLSFITIFFAIMVVTARNPIHSVLYLVLTFFGISANYILLLDAPFIGIVNLIVYAGAIMVLFLYVLMMMNLNADAEPKKPKPFIFAGIITGAMLLLILGAALKQAHLSVMHQSGISQIGTIQTLGKVLYTDYILPFEVASVLFLVSMVGAVLLGKRDSSSQTIGHEEISYKRDNSSNSSNSQKTREVIHR